jgi:hypothetical protein
MLLDALGAGLTAAGLALFVRACLDWSGRRPWLYKKPWGCNLCMAFWCSLPVSVAMFHLRAAFVVVPAYFVAYALLESFWAPPPPPLDDLIGPDEVTKPSSFKPN